MRKQSLLLRAQYGGHNDFRSRMPEVASLAEKKIAVVGLGSLGAPIAIEFARSGIGKLIVVDHDYFDVGNACRWPLGIAFAGIPKEAAIRQFLADNYIWTTVKGINRRFGAVHLNAVPANWPKDRELLEEYFAEVDLIIDASAEEGVMHLLSEWAWHRGKDYLMVAGTAGGWGGEVALISRSQGTGCWGCYRAAQVAKVIPVPPGDPQAVIQPRGCGSPTFIGTGFDMQQIALIATRIAVSNLCHDVEGGYPAIEGHAFVISLRTREGQCLPVSVTTHHIRAREGCAYCG